MGVDLAVVLLGPDGVRDMVWFLKAVGHRGLRFSSRWVEKRKQSCVGLCYFRRPSDTKKAGTYLAVSRELTLQVGTRRA